MLVEPDRTRRYRLFKYVPKPLDSFVGPRHLIRQMIDERIDFGGLAAPLAFAFSQDTRHPAIPPETLVRALVVSYVYRIPSLRRLCGAIQENLAFWWFLCLGLEDEVFDHSTLTVFVNRIGVRGFSTPLQRLNHDLARVGLLSTEAFVDSSLVQAAVSSSSVNPTSLTPEEFARMAAVENGVWAGREVTVVSRGRRRPIRLVRRYYQDAKGRLPLNHRDSDARWRRTGGKPARLSYKQHVVVDGGGFILSQFVTNSVTRDADPVPGLLDKTPVPLRVLTADTGHSVGVLRRLLLERRIETHIPPHTRHREHRDERRGFHLLDQTTMICPTGNALRRSTFYKKSATWLYSARVADCQACERRESCLPPKSKRRFVELSEYEAEFQLAEVCNAQNRHRRLMRRRKSVVEGVSAHLKDMGLRMAHRFGLAAVASEGYLVALAHNILKAVSRRFLPQAETQAEHSSLLHCGAARFSP